jgi:nucleoside-diphosphate-sugar epimerase
MSRSVLFIGGTGTISWWCVKQALSAGWEVTVANRGQTSYRPLPQEVRTITLDVADDDAFRAALGGLEFDAVADFLSFTPERVRRNVGVFEGRIGQYVFISSASAYQKPVARLPITESTPLVNPYWGYSQAKIACEDLLVGLVRERAFPATIVRPSHTYDIGLPNQGGWTDIARLRAGKAIVVLGDGTSLWTLTHASDFAYCYVPLLGDRRAIGDTFHITGDEVLPWDAIYTELAHAAGVAQPKLVHVASERIAAELPDWGPGLLGDKSHSVVFDNSKVRSIATGFAQRVPFAVGARQIIAHYDAHPERQVTDPAVDAAYDRLIAAA